MNRIYAFASFALLGFMLPAFAAEPEDYAREMDESFGIGSGKSIIAANDLGLVNGHVTFNGRIEDVTLVKGLYAPPYYCNDFVLALLFDGRRIAATNYFWRPEVLVREGASKTWRIVSRLYPIADRRGGILEVEVTNGAVTPADLALRFDMVGTVGHRKHWGFGRPMSEFGWSDGVFSLVSGPPTKAAVAWTLGADNDAELKAVLPGTKRTFHVAFALGAPDEAGSIVRTAVADPRQAIGTSVAAWRERVRRLTDRMPRFETDDAALQRLYFRSLLHLLLTEWNVDEFVAKPYRATGGLNGGCICNYLWNFGGPYRLWPLLDPQSLKDHLKVFLKLDLTKCFAFAPSDGSPQGPYYPINQEKILFCIDAYVRETGDIAYLREVLGGKTMVEWAVQMALTHDDLSKDAVLADYGKAGKSHLELRKDYLYDGVMPDLNLRRIALLHMADGLCRMAGYDPKVDLVGRAEALKKLVRKELWDADAGWFRAICSDGKPTLRYTMQMFKALGWGEKVLDKDIEAALVKRLMDPREFLGTHGVHSLSKLDPAYDENDVDNGGPGACPSFAPAICDRLFRDGYHREANEIFVRLQWLGDSLPYWGDSQYADRADYRRDTPLQCDVEGACLAQTIIFGLFGVTIDDGLRVSFDPHLPKGVGHMRISNLRLAGKTYEVDCSSDRGVSVRSR